jgi:hypothetical protein
MNNVVRMMLDSKTYVAGFQICHSWENYKTLKPALHFLTTQKALFSKLNNLHAMANFFYKSLHLLLPYTVD